MEIVESFLKAKEAVEGVTVFNPKLSPGGVNPMGLFFSQLTKFLTLSTG